MFEAAGVQSKQNGFRHSFASYHLAQFRDSKETARILGHVDPNVIHNHYKQLVSAREAERFWSLRPKEAAIVVSIAAA
jgi:integrase